MQHNDVKQYVANCPDLAGLDETSLACLFWRGEEVQLGPDAVLYTQGAALDDTFCLLISGELFVEIGGRRAGKVEKNQLFGEMAYFVNKQARTATVRAGSLGAVILKIRLSGNELAEASFAGLKSYLGIQAWDRFVSNSQRSL